MKVQCGQCPAKYSVADDRISDKKVRIHCKRCGASIVVDGKVSPPLVTSTPARRSVRPAPSAAPPSLESAPPPGEPESQPSPRPVAHTILGGLEAPTREQLDTARPSAPTVPPQPIGMPAEGRGFTDPPGGEGDGRWRVALTKQDLRWMTTAEIVEAYAAGAVQLETFVFRVGMPTWVTLLEVPEIARALGEDGDGREALINGMRPSSMPPPRRPPRRAPREVPEGVQAGGDEGDPLPFALVSERSSSSKKEAAADSSSEAEAAAPAPTGDLGSTATPEPPAPAAVAAPAPVPADDFPPPPPFASNVLAPPSSSSRVWLWVIVLLAIAVAAAVFVGPRFGFRLF